MKASKFSDAQKAFIIKQRGRWDAGRGDLPEGRDQPGDTQPTEECGSCSGCDAFEPRPAATRPARKKARHRLIPVLSRRKKARAHQQLASKKTIRGSPPRPSSATNKTALRGLTEMAGQDLGGVAAQIRHYGGQRRAHGQHPVADRDLAASTASITKPSLRPVLARIADHPITRISEFLSWNLQITPART